MAEDNEHRFGECSGLLVVGNPERRLHCPHARNLQPRRRGRDARRDRVFCRRRQLHEADDGRSAAFRGALFARRRGQPRLRRPGRSARGPASHCLRARPACAPPSCVRDAERALLHHRAIPDADRGCDRHSSDRAPDSDPGRRFPHARAGRRGAGRAGAGRLCRRFSGRPAGACRDFAGGPVRLRVRGFDRRARSRRTSGAGAHSGHGHDLRNQRDGDAGVGSHVAGLRELAGAGRLASRLSHPCGPVRHFRPCGRPARLSARPARGGSALLL